MKLALFGIFSGIVGNFLCVTGTYASTQYDGINLVIAPFMSKVFRFFTDYEPKELSFAADTYSFTEFNAITITLAASAIFVIISYVCAIASIKRNEHLSASLASFFVANSTAIIFDFKFAIPLLVLSGVVAIYVRIIATRNRSNYRNGAFNEQANQT